MGTLRGVLREERDRRITAALRAAGTASAAELAAELGVSSATIRRDLARLDHLGAVRRVYGGATLVESETEQSENFETIDRRDAPDKDAVAVAAADLVRDDDVVLLDIGTTTARLARRLRGRAVTVITGNVAAFDELRDDQRANVVLLGGLYRAAYRSLTGSLLEAALAEVSADRLFLSCTGVRSDGSVVDDMAGEARAKRAMLEAAESVVLLAHHDKFPGTGSLRICGLSDIDTVVTTPDIDPTALETCRRLSGKVLIG